mmetsp:Transcript_24273/g.61290  ORF Transcript_24273/g.61290 Transcript_24273/m.61290 type:complete len:80 (-) Transcript_24273:323-562(-)
MSLLVPLFPLALSLCHFVTQPLVSPKKEKRNRSNRIIVFLSLEGEYWRLQEGLEYVMASTVNRANTVYIFNDVQFFCYR